MFVFSDLHNHQNETAVKQILVFGSQPAKDLFESLMQTEIKTRGFEKTTISGKGAIYMLRAVLEGTGKYKSVIRCGVTGHLLWVSADEADTFTVAMKRSLIKLQTMLKPDINEMDMLKFWPDGYDETKTA